MNRENITHIVLCENYVAYAIMICSNSKFCFFTRVKMFFLFIYAIGCSPIRCYTSTITSEKSWHTTATLFVIVERPLVGRWCKKYLCRVISIIFESHPCCCHKSLSSRFPPGKAQLILACDLFKSFVQPFLWKLEILEALASKISYLLIRLDFSIIFTFLSSPICTVSHLPGLAQSKRG